MVSSPLSDNQGLYNTAHGAWKTDKDIDYEKYIAII